MPDAVRAFVGNFKGPKGEQGIQGPAGPQGIQGPAGPSNADGIDTVDTSGVLVSAGESTDLQRLIDAIADKVMTKLLAKTDIVQVESTATNTVPSSAYLKKVKDDINSNLESLADGYKLIMVGTVQTGNIGGTSGAQTSFQFGRTFSQPPRIITENSGGIIVSGTRDITGTGCQILLYNPTGGTKSDTITVFVFSTE